jgi:hypothetical protein
MLISETEPGVFRVVAEDAVEAQTIRAMFSLKVKIEKSTEDEPVSRTYEDFSQMRETVAQHWEQMRTQGIQGPVFQAIECLASRSLGLRCLHTGREWLVSLQGIKLERTRWMQLMVTPERRRLLATHPNFAKWARSSNPLAPCGGIKVNLETLTFEPA